MGYSQSYLDQLSKTLVHKFGANTLFVLEDLTGVSFERADLPKALRNQNKSWAFYQLAQFLTYKEAKTKKEIEDWLDED